MHMRTRQEIKAIAKEAIKTQRGVSILLYVVLIALSIAGGFVSLIPVVGALAFTAAVLVIEVGMLGGYVKIYRGITAEVGDLFSGFNSTFMRKLGGMLWMALWVFLWALLLYIPGIIKAISYSMTPYILGEYPNVKATDALKLSMRMTDGHKGELFVAFLSFIGWHFLSTITFGIVGVVYAFPYMSTTMAGYYTELRDLALTNGIISTEELA